MRSLAGVWAVAAAAALTASCADAHADPVGIAEDLVPTAFVGGPYTGAPEIAVWFDGSDSRGAGGAAALHYAWEFGDGTEGTGMAPAHAYANPGFYSVRLAVTDANGASSPPVATTVTIMAPATSPLDDVILVGAGDIADCAGPGDEATAALLDGIGGTVFVLGDNVYPNGSLQQYRDCYAHSWGRHASRTRPTPGNHEYNTAGGAGYYDYFGGIAGPRGAGYYSYDLGAWHVVVLNSNIDRNAGSAQVRWLRADLAAHTSECTIAYWHHPRFSSSKHGDDASVGAFWDALYEAGVEIVLGGHDHVYERFAPQSPAARPDAQRGIRAFVVGTGGKAKYDFGKPRPNSEVRSTGTPGVLKFTLRPGSYDWEFVPVPGASFRDVGTGDCH
jgi:PKD repeat protein